MLWPTSDLVARTWLSLLNWPDPVPGIATTLPDTELWTTALFIQVTTVGGPVNNYLPVRTPIVQLDFYAKAARNSSKPQWQLANHAAEVVIAATFGAAAYVDSLALPGDYDSVRIVGVSAVTEPRRTINDIQALARYTMDIEIPFLVKALNYE